MKTILLSLVLGVVALHSSFGQTLKNLTYNASNGQVIANTGSNVLTFTNSVYIGGSIRMLDGTNEAFEFPNDAEAEFSYGISFLNINAASSTRTNLGLGATWLTNTNVTNFRTAVGLGSTNFVIFNGLEAMGVGIEASGILLSGSNATLSFEEESAKAQTRTNLGLGATWLTNTNSSNFRTAIGALATNGSAAGLTNFPTLNQNTTGTASNVTGVVAITNGGTGTNSAGGARTNLELGVTNSVVFSNITANGTLGVSNAATFATNVTIVGNLTAKSLVTSDPVNIILDATQTSAATNGVLTLPDNANLIRLTNNNAISAVTNGRLGSFYYLVNQATNAVTLSNVGGITVDGATNLTLAPNESATLVALGPTNISVANRGGLETNNNVTFSNITASGASFATNVGIGITNPLTALHISKDAASFTAGDAQLTVGGSTDISKKLIIGYNTTGNYSFLESANFGVAVTPLSLNPSGGNVGIGTTTPSAKLTVNGTLGVTGNATFSGTDNLAPSQTTNSASSLMTRGLSDARYSPMPMTPQIIPWFYNGSLSVTRVTNGSATFGTSAAYPSINLTTNGADSGVTILTDQVWGAVDSGANPWNLVGRSVIIQGRLAATGTNAVARFVWSSSTNWPTIMTNLGTNGISNAGWAVETRNTGVVEARLIVNGATNKSESAWTPIGITTGNDSSFMVVGRAGFTSLYWAATGDSFTRTPLITVTNQIGGSVAGAFIGGLGFSVINTNTPAGTSTIYIRRCYQVLGMTNYGY